LRLPGNGPSSRADRSTVAVLILGSTGASCRPRGIAASDVLHAVRAVDCTTLCGAPVVFVFLETEFPGPDLEAPICPDCSDLALAEAQADAAVV
jgi:hypothetical protein